MKPLIIALFITFKSKPLSLQLGMQIIRSLLVVSLLGASPAIYAKRLPLEKLNLPDGFVIEKR